MDEKLHQIRRTAIRGRVALALTCLERALQQYDVHDERVVELVEVLWRFVEERDLAEADRAWRETRATDLLDAVDRGEPIPETYRGLPEFLARVLLEALEIGLGNLYAGVAGYSQGTFEPTVKVLELCERHGVPIPDPGVFATRMPFSEARGWGKPVPRSFFSTD